MHSEHKVRSTKVGRSGVDADDLRRLRSLIQHCTDIPEPVREADVAYIDDRVLDEVLFSSITETHCRHQGTEAGASPASRRHEALLPFVGKRLVCLVITLPGVRYTFEICPIDERIVHWEWQPQ